MDVLLQIKREARKSPARIVFCDKDPRITAAIKKIKEEKVCTPILLKDTVEKNIERAGEMLDVNEADAVITGATHPTSWTIRLAINVGLKKGVDKISGGMLLVRNGDVFYFADCAAIIDPSAAELAEIALLSQKTFELLTSQKASVAMLSYSTLGSADGESAKKVREALMLLKKKKIDIFGEVQVDAALSPEVMEQKTGKKGSKANVFIFPNLDAGNIGYKLAERLGGFRAIGPILQGVKKPVNDLSRSCSVQDIVDLSAVTSVQNGNLDR